MNYEIVNLEEKTVVGVKARTNNASPEMGAVIGGLWDSFYNKGIYAGIQNKTTQKALGIYTNYASDDKGDYDVVIACEVSKAEGLSEEMVKNTIPAGRYAKFVVVGDMQKAVGEAWGEIWGMDLDRAFTADFEEYQDDCMGDNATIHIYVALK